MCPGTTVTGGLGGSRPRAHQPFTFASMQSFNAILRSSFHPDWVESQIPLQITCKYAVHRDSTVTRKHPRVIGTGGRAQSLFGWIEGAKAMTLTALNGKWPTRGAVVPAFNGRTEKFVLRAFRLLRRSLMQADGDAGKVLTKHLRAQLSADEANCLLSDLTMLYREIHVIDHAQNSSRTSAKWSSKDEFFLMALLESSQRRDRARASESAIALLDSFEVAQVLDTARLFARHLDEFGLRLMPIGDVAFSYFADYKPIEQPFARRTVGGTSVDAMALRIVGSA